MPKLPGPDVDDLRVSKTTRLLVLPKPLSKATVEVVFDEVLTQSRGVRLSRRIREERESSGTPYVYSFLCFRIEPPVPFLITNTLREVRYGFVLLIERNGHLGVFHQSAKGLDKPLKKKSKSVDRRALTHIFADHARYQKISTRRMTVSNQELRRASFEADDLETAIVPTTAARSIMQTIGMHTDHGTIGVNPGTGRLRVVSDRATIDELVAFMDTAIEGIAAGGNSSFLDTFPEPVDLADLPDDVVPTGALLDIAALHEWLESSENNSLQFEANALDPLSEVFTLQQRDDKDFDAVNNEGEVVGRLKRFTSSFNLTVDAARFLQVEAEGTSQTLDQWIRTHHAFSVTFSSPEYFYTAGKLSRRSGFKQEAEQVSRFLRPLPQLDTATSEKGGPYTASATTFDDESIFHIVESNLAATDQHLWCCDLGDEWADYVGIGPTGVTFYHCKHGDLTSGAGAFHIVVAQAIKNLSRIRARREEFAKKVQDAKAREFWGKTAIPLLAKDSGGWAGLEHSFVNALGDPTMRWHVVLAVTALSAQRFAADVAKSTPPAYFVQLVYLLSGFIANCRERDAQPIIYCRP